MALPADPVLLDTSNGELIGAEIILPTITYISIESIGEKCWLAIDGMFG